MRNVDIGMVHVARLWIGNMGLHQYHFRFQVDINLHCDCLVVVNLLMLTSLTRKLNENVFLISVWTTGYLLRAKKALSFPPLFPVCYWYLRVCFSNSPLSLSLAVSVGWTEEQRTRDSGAAGEWGGPTRPFSPMPLLLYYCHLSCCSLQAQLRRKYAGTTELTRTTHRAQVSEITGM